MPLFKRRQAKDEESPDKKLEKGKPSDEEALEEEKGAEEKAEEKAEKMAEGEAEEKAEEKAEGEAAEETEDEFGEDLLLDEAEEDDDIDEEGDDVPSIDELLEEASLSDAEPEPEPAGYLDEALGELTGEDVQVLKMARKVVVIGDPAVGKTSLIKRWVKDVFDDRYLNTIGAKVMKKELGITRPGTGEIVDLKLILWDIAGQESFDTVKKAYYRGATGAIVICDVTRRDTMDHMHRWIENLFDVTDVIPMVIIINKIDLDSEFTFSEEEVIDEYAPYGAGVYLTSAKTGENVEMVFHELGKVISK